MLKKICISEDGMQSLEKMLSALNSQKNFALEVFVVEDTTVNAFAAPGGKIILYSGLIENSESPSELAGVIAHEMGHVLKKHPTEGFVRSSGLTLMAQLMLGNVGNIGDVGIAGQTLFELNYSRDAEREADEIALKLLEESNIDPNGLKAFFEKVKKGELDIASDILSYLSTHPKTSERIDTIPNKPPNQKYKMIMSESEWSALRDICKD